MKKWLGLVCIVIVLGGCNSPTDSSNPYDGKGDLQDPEKPKDKPIVDEKPKGALGLAVDDTLLFVEGATGEYDVKATVPEGGTLIIEVKDLPPGMVYDAANMKLVWTPNYQAANDPNNPNTNSRQYLIETKAYDQRNPLVALTKQSIVIVNDTPRPAGVKSALEILGIEGSPLAHIIEFEDQEYPAGPFDVSVAGLPIDAVVDFPNKTLPRFILRWTPTFDKVINKTEDVYTGRVIIYNPRGKRLEFNVVWTIANRFAPPLVAGPVDITQPIDVDFVVMAEDQNSEFTPQWTASHPGYGNLTVQTQAVVGGSGRPKSMGIVSWKNIPKDKLGLVATLNLRACIQTSTCTSHQVRVLPTVSVLGEEKK